MKMQTFTSVVSALILLEVLPEGAVASTIVSSDNGYDYPSVPLQMGGLVAADAGSSFVLALEANGQVTNLVTNSPAMNPPAGLSNVTAISVSVGAALALTSNGTVVAWSFEGLQTNVPNGLSNVVAISAGHFTDLALRSDGTVASWGNSTNVPSGLSNVVAVAAGFGTFALEANGTVVAWGPASTAPPGLSNVIAISSGQLMAYGWAGQPFQTGAVALLADGSVIGWDNNSVRTNPLPAGVTNTVAISGNLNSLLALQGDGSVVIAGTPPMLTFSTPLSEVYSLGQLTFGSAVVLEGEGWPIFTVQPGNQTTGTGGTIYLHGRVVASQAVPYQWQWQLNGTNIAGATNGDLIITNATVTNAGNYQALVSFNFGFDWAASSVAAVTIQPPPVQIPALLSAPIRQLDGSFMLTASATNGEPFPLTNSALFILQASSDLLNWTPLTNSSTLTSGAIEFIDPEAASSPARFYRLLGQ